MGLRAISIGLGAAFIVAIVAAGCGSEGRAPLAARDGGRGPEARVIEAGTFVNLGDAGVRSCDSASLNQEGCACPKSGDTRVCYTAADATRNKGICKDGTQTCAGTTEFLAWGPCVGAIEPTKETCASSVDTNCSGSIGCEDPSCASDPVCDTPCTDGDTRPCYDGKPGTQGVGACKSGTQTCINGKWSKACTGQTLPGSEGGHCGDGLDNDCNGLVDCKDLASCLLDPKCLFGCTAGTTRSCYEGPVGTEGVAACHGGTQTCKPDGSGFDACTGQALPAAEICGDGIDNDCDGFADCQDPECSTKPQCCVPATTVDGTIWANSPQVLYRIDPVTFSVTTIGSFKAGEEMTDLAITTAGDLYGVSMTTLYSIDKTTAKATSIASLAGASNNALAFLANGKLVGADGGGDVKSIAPATGAATHIGNYGNGLKSAGDIVATADGSVYATSASSAGGGDASSDNVLLRVNIATGVASAIGPTGHANVWGLAYANAKVIGFTTGGKILQIDPATGASTVIATKNIEFWGATQSPGVTSNACP